MCEGDGGRREGWKNEAVNGAPCHERYGKKHRMNWKNERKVQKGAEGKEKTGPTTCLSLSLSLSPSLPLSYFISFTPLLTHRQTLGRGCSPRPCLATDMFLFSREKVSYQQDLKLTVIHHEHAPDSVLKFSATWGRSCGWW